MEDIINKIGAKLMQKKPKVSIIPAEDLLSTGSTMLDLGISGRIAGGIGKGMYCLFVGNSGAGKTFLFNTCLAEAARNPSFNDYKFVTDMPEDGAKMDYAGYFGQKCADRVQAPNEDENGNPIYSRLLEEFYDSAEAYFSEGPCIYVLDSENALSCQALQELYQEQKAARDKGKDIPQSYGMEKAKIHAARMPGLIDTMQKSRSILIIVSQSRQKIGATRYEKQTTRSGGTALKFYAQVEIWMSIKEHLKKTVRGVDRKNGILSKVDIEKNRISGKNRTVFIPIYNSHGIDDIGSCVDFLIEEKHWPKKNGIIWAKEFDQKLDRESLIKYIEDEDEKLELKATVETLWEEIEAATSVDRKPNYE